ncbi:heavy metal sensor histidine kinase [Hydrogenophaga sp.]|uniref:heavy metal sensor histidine kinase n=1 Tax=Hydrogenophaga sp. TaxID=1904254 RepID=UPI0035675174
MFRRLTLTARLTLLYTTVSVAVLCGLVAMVMAATQAHFVELDRDSLRDKAELVKQVVANSASQQQLAFHLGELLQSHSGLYVRLEHVGKLVFSYNDTDFPAHLALADGTPSTTDWTADGVALRGMQLKLATPPFLEETGQTTAAQDATRLLLAVDTHHHIHFLVDLRRSLTGYLVLAALASGLLGWWAARRGLAPLRDMKERALRVTAHQLGGERMPVHSVPVEMAELAQGLNDMLERLQRDFERLSEFSSDLAHELRTPISNLLTQTQVSLAQQRDAPAYRDILASNAEEFQRLARMVSDMLLLAKTEHGLALPHREPIALRDEVQALFEFYDAVADEKNVTLVLEGEAHMAGDRLMVRRAISNLLSNALRHSAEGGRVRVQLSCPGGEPAGTPTLCIENTGNPIDPAHLARLFDRFYRTDKSRAHLDTDGTGLGLAITRAIMEAHGGTVSVESTPAATRFCLRFGAA